MRRKQGRDRSGQAGPQGPFPRGWGCLCPQGGSQTAACPVLGGQPDLANKNPRGPVTARFQINNNLTI